MPIWREKYPGVETLRVAVMGCVVNGPGESKHADIGISLPGSGEAPRAPVYVDGKLHSTLQGDTPGPRLRPIARALRGSAVRAGIAPGRAPGWVRRRSQVTRGAEGRRCWRRPPGRVPTCGRLWR